MFGKQLAAFSPRRRRLNTSKFFSKISSSLSDIPGDVFRSTLETDEISADKKDDFYEVMANCVLEKNCESIKEEDGEDLFQKDSDSEEMKIEKSESKSQKDECISGGNNISKEMLKGECNKGDKKTNGTESIKEKGNSKADASCRPPKDSPCNTPVCNSRPYKQKKIMSPVRDRSRVGMRSSLPFSTMGLTSGASSSGVSSGSSDTQSQGSGGDSKSDSPTPEGSRKNGEVSSSSSSSSSSGVVSGVGLRCAKGHELPVTPGARESAALRQEVETLRAEITKARQTILHMQEREKKLKDRLGDRASRGIERGSGRVENLNLGERRPSALVRRYGNLYAQARVDTLDSLDSLADLKNAEELKSKLLFSVVVLAFRSAASSAAALREEVRRAMQMPPPPCHGDGHDHHVYDSQSHSLELAISSYVTSNIDKHDLTKNVDEVCQQIWATLYDYPTLKSCEGLLQYIKDCVRLAWGLNNQTPPYVIDYETRSYKKECHVRFHTADPDNEIIKTYLWPALVEGPGGPCVQKGVVVT